MSKLLLHRAQPVVLAARSGLLTRRTGAPTAPQTARGLFVALAAPRPHRSSATKLFSAPVSSSSSSSSSSSLSPSLLSFLDPAASDPLTLPYDAIMILGGGIETSDGSLPPWVLTRLDFAAALQRESCSSFPSSSSSSSPPIVLLGAGTPHKPPPPDGDTGRALTEAKAAARYLLSLGDDEKENESEESERRRTRLPLSQPSQPPLSPSSILKEEASFDTVGNALFGLTTHALPAGWTRIAVVTSSFHMPRARAIFTKTFALASEAFRSRSSPSFSSSSSSLAGTSSSSSSSSSSVAAVAPGGEAADENQPPLPPFELSFLATRDKDDLADDVREARAAREAASTARWISDTENIKTLRQLHAWVHAEHLCYSTAKQELFGSFATANRDIDPKALASY